MMPDIKSHLLVPSIGVAVKSNKRKHQINQRKQKRVDEIVKSGKKKFADYLLSIGSEVQHVNKVVMDLSPTRLMDHGLKAQLSTPAHERKPLLLSDIQDLLHAACLPNYPCPILPWFKKLKKASQVLFIIVEGVSLNTFYSIGLNPNKAKKYHQRMLSCGQMVSCAEDQITDVDNNSHNTVLLLDDCLQNKQNCSEGNLNNKLNGPNKRKKMKASNDTLGSQNTCLTNAEQLFNSASEITNVSNDICDKNTKCLQRTSFSDTMSGSLHDCVLTWLSQTSRVLNCHVEVVSPAVYGGSVQDVVLMRCSNSRLKDVHAGRTAAPKTLKKLTPIGVLYRRVQPKIRQASPSQPVPNDAMLCSDKQRRDINSMFNITEKAANITTEEHWGRGSNGKSKGLKKLCEDKFDRRKLLVTFEEMFKENYPLPQHLYTTYSHHYQNKNNIFAKENNFIDCVPTKDKYAKVKPSSPMFGLDCEFVSVTGNRMSLGSISIVNEYGHLMYHTLVKPKEKVVDYATRWSGLTKAMLKDVTTRVEDVQQHIRMHLPPDAVLVGHSLANDLRVMKMHHPYLMDTSLLYNLTGVRAARTKLKTLAKTFLNRDIQMKNKIGHSPTEDAEATLQLVQLKLQHEESFGNKLMQAPGLDGDEDCYYYNMFEYIEEWNALGKLLPPSCSGSSPRVCTILTTQAHSTPWQAALQGLDRPPRVCVLEDNSAVVDELCSSSMLADITIAHLQADPRLSSCKLKTQLSALTSLDAALARIYTAAAHRALCCVLFTGAAAVEGEDLISTTASSSNGFMMFGTRTVENL